MSLSKLTRRVKRNQERARKARGLREKAMQHAAFKLGFNTGAEMFKARVLYATAGYQYEEETHEVVEHPVLNVDHMSEYTLDVSSVEALSVGGEVLHVPFAIPPAVNGVDAFGFAYP